MNFMLVEAVCSEHGYRILMAHQLRAVSGGEVLKSLPELTVKIAVSCIK